MAGTLLQRRTLRAPGVGLPGTWLSATGAQQAVQVGGVLQTQRSAVDFVGGAGVTVAASDDAANNRTIVTVGLAAPVNVTPPVIT
jgi:hypothetical protein